MKISADSCLPESGVAARRFLCALLLTAIASGCAKVEVKRVGDGEDGLEGVRYYMPRPYVMVNEPFVVAADTYVVDGRLSVDGQYVLITGWDDKDGPLSKVLRGAKDHAIKASSVLVAAGDSGEAQAGEEESEQDQEEEDTTPETTPEGESKGGRQTVSVTNDNAAYAVTPLKRYMDIVWLPDFEEQYAVTGKGGFGNSSIEMGMGQGWSLQSLDIDVDNSAIVDPLLGFYKQTLDGLSTVVQTKLGVVPVPGGETGPQSGEELPTAASFQAGMQVSVKVTIARMAAPGLYPILKESEFGAVDGLRNKEDYVLVPVPPLTRIAFNTYQVVVIEAATAVGDSPLRMHQYPVEWDKAVVLPGGNGPPKDPSDPSGQLNAIADDLNTAFGTGDTDKWEVTLAWNASTKRVIAELTRFGTPPINEDDAKQKVRDEIKTRTTLQLEGDVEVIDD